MLFFAFFFEKRGEKYAKKQHACVQAVLFFLHAIFGKQDILSLKIRGLHNIGPLGAFAATISVRRQMELKLLTGFSSSVC